MTLVVTRGLVDASVKSRFESSPVQAIVNHASQNNRRVVGQTLTTDNEGDTRQVVFFSDGSILYYIISEGSNGQL